MDYFTITYFSSYGMVIPTIVFTYSDLKAELEKLNILYQEKQTMVEIKLESTKDFE
tara:strand:- start:18286 stop:18453 length:168 start_codon:yes stop_codon:yes gene_type:complete